MAVYLDHAATTPLRPEALAAMLPFLTDRFGNPSGSHTVARAARQALDEARDSVAAGLGCDPSELVFTGPGTESDNLAVLGAQKALGGSVVCSAIEHRAVLSACRSLGGTTVAVDATGVIDLGALAESLHPGVAVVSVMLANNEVGTIQPLAEVVDLVRQRAPDAVVHTDAVAAVPWLDVAAAARPADLVSVSAHKFGGPPGVGALVVRRGTRLGPVLHGGAQEHGRRPGTHDLAGIVGMAAALSAALAARPARYPGSPPCATVWLTASPPSTGWSRRQRPRRRPVPPGAGARWPAAATSWWPGWTRRSSCCWPTTPVSTPRPVPPVPAGLSSRATSCWPSD